MEIIASFVDNGTPATGLTPTIRIRQMDGTLLITDAVMTEIGDGSYYYDYTTYDPDIPVTMRCDGGDVLSGHDRYSYATNEIITDLTAGMALESTSQLIKTETDKIQTIDTSVDSILEDTETSLPATLFSIETKVDTIDTNVDSVLVDTADMQPKVDVINTRVDQTISTTESNIRGSDGDDLKDISDQIDSLSSSELLEIAALLGKNSVYEHSFDSNHNHIAFTQYCYDSAANKQTHDKITGLIFTFEFEVTYNSDDNPTITEKENA
ncbi:MAG: hypothetical protein GY853_16045 [PVC group bacterium]|nr:hypothetical protein [PVC group bacterium]